MFYLYKLSGLKPDKEKEAKRGGVEKEKEKVKWNPGRAGRIYTPAGIN